MLKIGVKIILRIITRKHAADPEIRFLTKSISLPYGHAAAMPKVRELINEKSIMKIRIFENVDVRLTFLSVIDKNSSSKSTTRPPLLQEFQMNEKLEKAGKNSRLSHI